MNEVSDRALRVEFIEHSGRSTLTGTGRYLRELYDQLACLVELQRVSTVDPPFVRYVPALHHFPAGIQGHHRGAIAHFAQPLGSTLMLWRPVGPAVATVHDLSWMSWPPEARMFRKVERAILSLSYHSLKRMDALIAISEFTRQAVIQHLHVPEERVFTIHSGTRTDRFRPLPAARSRLAPSSGLPLAGQERLLLYVGNEYPRKNLPTLLKALSLLPENVRLVKAGTSGGWRFRQRTLQAVQRLGLEGRMTFLDEVSDEELTMLYNAADVYICPSSLEGFGHPVLEAMSCGTPVVCSNAASLPEIAGDAALLVPPEEAEAFADAITTVLENQDAREEMSARGMKRAGEFSWEQTAQKVVDVYRFVHGKGGGDAAG